MGMKKIYIHTIEVPALKLQTLEYFIALAECGSINKAAQVLYIAQPSLTKSLQNLEDELGMKLFVRGRSGIVLTDAGKKILPQARQVVAIYQGWLAMAHEDRPQSVDIYSHISLSNFLLPDVLLAFKKRDPELVINQHAVLTPESFLSREAVTPALALFICQESSAQTLAREHGNRFWVLFSGEYGCLVNHSSPLALRSSVTLDDLREFYFIYPELAAGAGQPASSSPILERVIQTASTHRAIQVESVGTVIQTIRNHADSYALSFYPALNRYEGVAKGELVYVPIEGAQTRGELCLFCSSQAYGQYPVLRELVRDIQTAAEAFLAEVDS